MATTIPRKRDSQQGGHLDAFFCSPHDSPARWLLMWTAYLDESGHETRDLMFVAGFLGSEDQWREFVPLWQKALGPQRKHLHMASLRWNKESTRRLLERLGPIPNQCKLTPLVGGVRFRDYEDLVSGTPAEKLLKGYMSCVYPVVINTLRILPDDERLEVVFEEQHEYEPYVHLMLADLASRHPDKPDWMFMKAGRPKLAKWSFVPKGTTILTDPADYFSYGLLQAWRDKKSKRAQWCQPILKSGSGEGIGRIVKREEIRKIISQTHMRLLHDGILRRINVPTVNHRVNAENTSELQQARRRLAEYWKLLVSSDVSEC